NLVENQLNYLENSGSGSGNGNLMCLGSGSGSGSGNGNLVGSGSGSGNGNLMGSGSRNLMDSGSHQIPGPRIRLNEKVELNLKIEEFIEIFSTSKNSANQNSITSFPFFFLQEWSKEREKPQGDARAPKFFQCQKCFWLLGAQAPL